MTFLLDVTLTPPGGGRCLGFQQTRQMGWAGSAGRADTPRYRFLFHRDHSQAHGLGRVALFGVAGDEGSCQP